MAFPQSPQQEDDDKAQPLTWKMLWQLPAGILTVCAITLPGLLLAFLPFIAGLLLVISFDDPSIYTPHSSWLWRCLLLLCMTHVSYGIYKLIIRMRTQYVTLAGLFPISMLSCVVGTILITPPLLNFINAYIGTHRILDGTVLHSRVVCNTTWGTHRTGFRRSTSCSARTSFTTAEGKLYVRGPSYDPAIRGLKPSTPVQLSLCQSIFGTSLMQIRRQPIWNTPARHSMQTQQACAAGKTLNAKRPGSVMDAVETTTN